MKWLRTYYIFVIMALIFLAVAWKFQPEDSGGVGETILFVLGILAIVGILMGGVYLYAKYGRKLSVPSFNGAGKFFGRIAGRDKIGTTLLVGLFLLTLSYVIGGREEWTDSLGWWWNSKIFLPSLLAVIGVILFVDAKYRKKIDRALIFTVSAMILFSFLTATPAITSLFEGGDEDKKRETSASQETPQRVVVEPVEVVKTKKETILAEYGAFTEVPLPPTEKLFHIRWDIPSRYNGRCLAVVIHESRPDGEVSPCENPIRGLYKVTRVGFSSDDPLEGVPVEVKITYLEAE